MCQLILTISYRYIDDVTVAGKSRFYIRELETTPGYELDKQYKTIYAQPGKQAGLAATFFIPAAAIGWHIDTDVMRIRRRSVFLL